jgi:predicted ester cyclase
MAPSRPKRGPPVKRAAEEGWLMRYLSAIVAPLGISATLLVGQAVAQVESPAPPECPIKTAVENTVIARAWHEDVINRRNPAILQDILASDVVHHAAGGYPKVMDATGIAAMMTEFLTAFPDLRYTFDQFIVQDDYVVERYTAVGTQQGQFGDLTPSGRMATWTGINIFRIKCGRIVEVWSEVDAVGRRQQLMGATSANSPR